MRGVTLLVFLLALLAALGCEAMGTAAPGGAGPGGASVRVGERAVYAVDVADDAARRAQGLSGRPFMGADVGMLFVFEEEAVRNFWMKEMHFPLDIIWIDGECRLIDVAAEVPAPVGDGEIARVSSPGPARYVLEVNAGEWAREGMAAGDVVEFLGDIAGRYGC